MQTKLIKKLKAMTFAELSITLLIIGVVCALTLPGLKKHVDRSEMAGLLKKSYAAINIAIDKSLAIDEEDSIEDWDMTSSNNMLDRISRHMQILQECPAGSTDCFASSYRLLNQSATRVPSNKAVILADGIAFQVTNCDGNTCYIDVDVNGPNEPNIVGYDYYRFVLNKSGAGLMPNDTEDDFGKSQKISEEGWKITYW